MKYKTYKLTDTSLSNVFREAYEKPAYKSRTHILEGETTV